MVKDWIDDRTGSFGDYVSKIGGSSPTQSSQGDQCFRTEVSLF